jgi:hypothetical protein
VGPNGSIDCDALTGPERDWVEEHLYCERYRLSHQQYLDEPVYAVRWRLAVGSTIERRVADLQPRPGG